MATESVRFEFSCMKKHLVFNHQIPSALLSQAGKTDPDLRNAFITAIYHVFLEHADACLRESNDTCPMCREPTVTVAWNPIINLDPVETLVVLTIAGFCGKKTCEDRIDHYAQLASQQVGSLHLPATATRVRPPRNEWHCDICGKPDAKVCAKCKTTAYCGKEHQKQDFKAHKKVCAQLANAAAAEEQFTLPHPELARFREM